MSSAILHKYTPDLFVSIENRVRDIFLYVNNNPKNNPNILIVDIDEKSLSRLGQWPWERNVMATLLEKLASGGVSVVGLDILFAEADKTSPSYINKKMKLGLHHPLDYDEILASALAQTPTVTGYVFDMKSSENVSTHPPTPKAMMIEKNKTLDAIVQARGVHTNIMMLQEKSFSSGYFNVFPDDSGVVRSVPLLLEYKHSLYPFLSLEMSRIFLHQPSIRVEYNELGVASVSLGDREIPVDKHGKLSIKYRGPSHTFKYVSAVDILNDTISQKSLAGKIVLIGSSAAGLLDLRATPLDGAMAGVEIHANIIDNILSQDFLSKPSWIEGFDIVMFVLLFSVMFFLFLSSTISRMLLYGIFSSFSVYYFIDYMVRIQGFLVDAVLPFLAVGLAFLVAMLINYIYESRQKKRIKALFSKKVSPQVVEALIAYPDSEQMQSREEVITTLFSDIRNFTNISESIGSARELVALLNVYIAPMTDIILEKGGTVDKFMGDGIMAYWNAPQSIENHADLAIEAALEQIERLKSINESLQEKFGISIEIGIGINTGKAIVGELGTLGRSDYTVIGDSINVAARLEALNKIYRTSIVISEETKARLKGMYNIRKLDSVTLKGRDSKTRIYEVLGKK